MELSKTRGSITVTTTDSPLAFVTKCLLHPTLSVLTLLMCLTAVREPLRGGYFLLAALTYLGAPEFLGFADIGRKVRHQHEFEFLNIALRWFLLVGFIGILLYLSGFGRALDYRLLTVWVAVTPVVLWSGQYGARLWFAHSLAHRKSVRHAVIVGVTDLGVRLEQALGADASMETEVMGFFEDRAPERLVARASTPILGNTRALPRYVARNNIEQVFITLPMNRNPRILSILDDLHDSTASIYFVPDLFAFNLIQAHFDVLNGIPVVAIRETPFYGASRLAKRVSDVLVASTAVILLSPLFLVIALCIRLDSAGPVLFKQTRYGLDGREILVYKFRSMKVAEDGKNVFTAASRSDSRVTRVGAVIRKTSLDELPQLFNVLKGSMSIIGPRPHTIAMNEHYRREIPSYMVRHKVKPGITGWAQVNGCRGGDDLESMRKRIEFDLEYLRNWSLWFDVRILLKTVAIIWIDRNAY